MASDYFPELHHQNRSLASYLYRSGYDHASFGEASNLTSVAALDKIENPTRKF